MTETSKGKKSGDSALSKINENNDKDDSEKPNTSAGKSRKSVLSKINEDAEK